MQRTLTLLGSFVLLVALSALLAGCGPNLIERVDNFWALGCCGMIIVILSIIAIVEIAGSPRTTGNKALWILLIIFAPGLGVILYYLFAR